MYDRCAYLRLKEKILLIDRGGTYCVQHCLFINKDIIHSLI